VDVAAAEPLLGELEHEYVRFRRALIALARPAR
jgi:hypothetical protein